jgi:spore coat protein U-like protein
VTVTSGGAALSNGADSMAYSVAVGAIPAGAGFGAAATLVRVTGTIPAASYQDAKALTYSDTVILTINN